MRSGRDRRFHFRLRLSCRKRDQLHIEAGSREHGLGGLHRLADAPVLSPSKFHFYAFCERVEILISELFQFRSRQHFFLRKKATGKRWLFMGWERKGKSHRQNILPAHPAVPAPPEQPCPHFQTDKLTEEVFRYGLLPLRRLRLELGERGSDALGNRPVKRLELAG